MSFGSRRFPSFPTAPAPSGKGALHECRTHRENRLQVRSTRSGPGLAPARADRRVRRSFGSTDPMAAAGRGSLRPVAEWPDFGPVMAGIEVRLPPSRGRKEGACCFPTPSGRASVRSRRGSRFASMLAESGSDGASAPPEPRSEPTDLVPSGRAGRGFRVQLQRLGTKPASLRAMGTREASALKEPSGTAEARFGRSNGKSSGLRPGRLPARTSGRAWSRRPAGKPSEGPHRVPATRFRLGQWGLVATPAPISFWGSSPCSAIRLIRGGDMR
jgi:hypothetical protein